MKVCISGPDRRSAAATGANKAGPGATIRTAQIVSAFDGGRERGSAGAEQAAAEFDRGEEDGHYDRGYCRCTDQPDGGARTASDDR